MEPFLFIPVFPRRWKDALQTTFSHSCVRPVSEDILPIVIDNGHAYLKAGVAGGTPMVIDTVLAVPKARDEVSISELPPIVWHEATNTPYNQLRKHDNTYESTYI